MAFVLVERRAAEPVLPLYLFRNRVFSAASAVGLVVGFAMFGALSYLPRYMQIVKGVSPTSSGLYLLSLLTVTTGTLLTSLYMLVLGAGIGASMQVLVIAVQNSVQYADLPGSAAVSSTPS